ncbi:MAG: hypothetical protein IT286_05735 [Proteobacteria bacterium]|jgi:hypothetical protein|nr:hypothetical protein [Pseudomonadota bacterium]
MKLLSLICLLNLSIIQPVLASDYIGCSDFFSVAPFQKLTIQSGYLFDDHSGPHPVHVGQIQFYIGDESVAITATPINADKWLPKNPSLIKVQKIEYIGEDLFRIPYGAEIRFANPSNTQITCTCTFRFSNGPVTKPIDCHPWNSGTENSQTSTRQWNNVRNTEIRGLIHK